jgi:hypothetical protein
MPVGTPRATCSARWQSCASASFSASVPDGAPNANAHATSSAALDDSPDPCASVVFTVPTNPVAGRTSVTTPAT